MEPPKVELPETFVEICRNVGLDPNNVEEILSEPLCDGGAWIVRINGLRGPELNEADDEKYYVRVLRNGIERYASYDEALDADLPQLTTSMEPDKERLPVIAVSGDVEFIQLVEET